MIVASKESAATKTSAELAAERDRLRERRANLEMQHADAEQELHLARERYARSVADAVPEGELRATRTRAREAAEEEAGLRSAGPLLDRELAAVDEALRKARASEARSEAHALVTTASEATASVDRALDVFVGEWMPMIDRATVAVESARRAEIAALELAGEPTTSSSRVRPPEQRTTAVVRVLRDRQWGA